MLFCIKRAFLARRCLDFLEVQKLSALTYDFRVRENRNIDKGAHMLGFESHALGLRNRAPPEPTRGVPRVQHIREARGRDPPKANSTRNGARRKRTDWLDAIGR